MLYWQLYHSAHGSHGQSALPPVALEAAPGQEDVLQRDARMKHISVKTWTHTSLDSVSKRRNAVGN